LILRKYPEKVEKAMIIKNRLDKSFGPFGGSTGFFLFLGGLAASWFSPYGLILAALGAFAAFTSTSTFIDTEKKRIRFSNDLFGIITTGKWIDITPGMKFGLKRVHRGYQAYTRANQTVGIHNVDFRIVLMEADNDEIMQVKKYGDRESAGKGIEELCTLFNISRTE
jgi:hypothetical protein